MMIMMIAYLDEVEATNYSSVLNVDVRRGMRVATVRLRTATALSCKLPAYL